MLIHDELRELLDEHTPAPDLTDSSGDWARVVSAAQWERGRQLRRAGAVGLVALLGVLIATPAFGLRDQAVRLFGGSTAPPSLQRALPGLEKDGPLGQVYVQVRTSVGARATLYSAETKHGRCLGIFWEGTGRRNDTMAQCGELDTPTPLAVSESGRRALGGWINLIWGTTAPDVKRVELVSVHGASLPVPVSADHFLVEVPRWAGDAYLVAFGASGLELGRHKLETPPGWLPPDPVGTPNEVAVRDFANRMWTLRSYETRDARHCFGLVTSYATGNPQPWERAGGDSFRCLESTVVDATPLNLLGPDQWPSLRGSDRVISIAGITRSDVQSVRLHFENDTETEIDIRNGGFLYLAYVGATGHPALVEAFNDHGVRIAKRSLR